MHINGTRKVIDKLNELFDLELQNETIKTAVIDPVYDGIIFKDFCQIDRMALELQHRKIGDGTYISLNEAKMVLMLSSIINDNKEDDDRLPDTFFDALFESAKFFKKEDLIKDPYFMHVSFPEKIEGSPDLSVKTTKLPKYSPFFYNGPEMFEPGYSVPLIGFVDKAVKVFAAYKDGKYWNSVGAETILSDNTISRTFMGRVLILGGGMGHFLYLTALNPNVTGIVLIDDNADSMNLIKNSVLPDMPFSEKVAMVQGSPMEYVMQMTDRTFDYVYVDESVTKNLPSAYLTVLDKFLKFEHTRFAIGSENDLQYMYRNVLMACFMQEAKDRGWQKNDTDEKKIKQTTRNEMEFMNRLLDRIEIKTPDDIMSLLDPENLVLAVSGS